MENQHVYKPVIIENEDGFCVYLAEKEISGEGPSLEDAYRDYQESFNRSQIHSKKYGLATISIDPDPIIKHRDVLKELITFWIKTFSVFVIAVIVLVLLLPNIRASAEYHMAETVRFAALQLPNILNSKLDRLKPEEKVQINLEWGELFEKSSSLLRDEQN